MRSDFETIQLSSNCRENLCNNHTAPYDLHFAWLSTFLSSSCFFFCKCHFNEDGCLHIKVKLMKEDGFGKRKEIAQWQFFCYFMIVYHKVFCCLFIWHTNIRKQNNEKKWNFYEDLAHFLELLAHFSDPSEGFMIHAKKKQNTLSKKAPLYSI